MSEASVKYLFGCRNIRKKGKYGPLWFQETAFERCWKITFHVLKNLKKSKNPNKIPLSMKVFGRCMKG